jgi:putative hydrolase of the HAD superfamily
VGRPPADGTAVAEAFDRLRDPTNVEPLPGARSVLDTLAEDYRLGLVTNGPRSAQEPKLAGAGLADVFDAIVFAGADTAPKPDPEPFERLVAELGVEPARAVMVGDSLSADVAGAQAVGMRTVYRSGDAAGPESSVVPDYRIRSLPDLLTCLSDGAGATVDARGAVGGIGSHTDRSDN